MRTPITTTYTSRTPVTTEYTRRAGVTNGVVYPISTGFWVDTETWSDEGKVWSDVLITGATIYTTRTKITTNYT